MITTIRTDILLGAVFIYRQFFQQKIIGGQSIDIVDKALRIFRIGTDIVPGIYIHPNATTILNGDISGGGNGQKGLGHNVRNITAALIGIHAVTEARAALSGNPLQAEILSGLSNNGLGQYINLLIKRGKQCLGLLDRLGRWFMLILAVETTTDKA